MGTRKINASDFNFPRHVDEIKTFRTLKDAQQGAKSIGWLTDNVLRIAKRFETVYIVAAWLCPGEEIGGDCYDAFVYPLFRWDDTGRGFKQMATEKAVSKKYHGQN